MTIRWTILDADACDRLRRAGLGDYEAFLRGGDGPPGGGRARRLALDGPAGGGEFFIKVYRYPSGRSRLRRDKGQVEARNYAYLRTHCGMAVPEVVCHASRRAGLRIVDAFIVTRAIPGAVPLDRFAAGRWPVPAGAAPDRARRALLLATADQVARMHAAGFFHVDLQWRNLLVCAPDDTHPRLFVIDSSRGGPRRWLLFREHGRLRDLSSLAKEAVPRLSRTERVRWLHRYFGVTRLRPEHKAMIRTIDLDRALKDNTARP
jgi:hypothetical protein